MKKKITLAILFALLVLATCGLFGCGESVHEHTFSKQYSYSQDYHYYKATCGCNEVVSGYRKHNFGSWRVEEEATDKAEGVRIRTCSKCDYVQEESIPMVGHEHTYMSSWSTGNVSSHWKKTTCLDKNGVRIHEDVRINEEPHDWVLVEGSEVNATESTQGSYQEECSVCGRIATRYTDALEHVHRFNTLEWQQSLEYHWRDTTCNSNSECATQMYGFEEHIWNNSNGVITTPATETTEGLKVRICVICEYEDQIVIPKLSHTHTFEAAYTSDSNFHWHASTCGCLVASGRARHTFNSSNICTKCNYEKVVGGTGSDHDHQFSDTYSYDNENHWFEATCNEHPSYSAYIDPHSFGSPVIVDATEQSAGSATYTCAECEYKKVEVIAKLPHTHKFSSTYSYDDLQHWKKAICDHGDIVLGLEEHVYDSKGKCDCGFQGTQGVVYSLVGEYYEVVGLQNTSATSITILDKINGIYVRSIAPRAFYDCRQIVSIAIGNNIDTVGDEAFYRCTNLTSVTFGMKTTVIGEKAFYGCAKLQAVALDGVQVIHNDAFAQCSQLRTLNISSSIKFLGEGVFVGCDILVNNAVSENNAYYLGNTRDGDYVLLYKSTQTADRIITSCTINPKTKVIAASAFDSCEKLSEIVIPDNVVAIGKYAFVNCIGLTKIVLPASIKDIDDNAFSGCTSIKEVIYKGTIDDWAQINFGSSSSNPIVFGAKLTIDSSEVTEINLTTATKVSDYAFYNFGKITRAVLGDNVKMIGEMAFYNCINLTSVILPNGIERVSGTSFEKCSNLVYNKSANGEYLGNDGNKYLLLVKITDKTVLDFTINSSTKIIGDEVFVGCKNLFSVTIPSSVTCIGKGAFLYTQNTFEFENANGWVAGDISISASELADSTYSVLFLTILYTDQVWVRS